MPEGTADCTVPRCVWINGLGPLVPLSKFASREGMDEGAGAHAQSSSIPGPVQSDLSMEQPEPIVGELPFRDSGWSGVQFPLITPTSRFWLDLPSNYLESLSFCTVQECPPKKAPFTFVSQIHPAQDPAIIRAAGRADCHLCPRRERPLGIPGELRGRAEPVKDAHSSPTGPLHSQPHIELIPRRPREEAALLCCG
jgi:hypothetical protein